MVACRHRGRFFSSGTIWERHCDDGLPRATLPPHPRPFSHEGRREKNGRPGRANSPDLMDGTDVDYSIFAKVTGPKVKQSNPGRLPRAADRR